MWFCSFDVHVCVHAYGEYSKGDIGFIAADCEKLRTILMHMCRDCCVVRRNVACVRVFMSVMVSTP